MGGDRVERGSLAMKGVTIGTAARFKVPCWQCPNRCMRAFSGYPQGSGRPWAALGGSVLPRGGATPLSTQPLPRVLALAASKVREETLSPSP